MELNVCVCDVESRGDATYHISEPRNISEHPFSEGRQNDQILPPGKDHTQETLCECVL